MVSDTEPLTVVNKPSGIATNNEEVICVIDYKQQLLGLVIINEEIPSHYHKMHIAIANTFVPEPTARSAVPGVSPGRGY